MPKGNPTPAIERFMEKIKVDANGCWLWQAPMAGSVYARFYASQSARSVYAHRWSYEHFKGPIPEGLVLDHLCRVKTCVNPDHLEAVTQYENVLRGESPFAQFALKTHCIHDHEFTPENTYYKPSRPTHRCCRTCHRLRAARRRAAA